MKPSTEIFKSGSEKKESRQASSHFKDFKNKKRRFKPQKPRLKSKETNRENVTKTFVKLDPFPTSDPSIDSSNQSSQLYKQTSSISDSFETTNMERNRVVLLQSNEVWDDVIEPETEIDLKYSAHSTTSRTLITSEENFILKQINSLTESAFQNTSSGEIIEDNVDMISDNLADRSDNSSVTTESDDDDSGVNSNKSVKVSDAGDDMVDQAFYRFKYKLVPSDDTNTSDDDTDTSDDDTNNDTERNSPIILQTYSYSSDGLYHPENAPTYEELINDDNNVLSKFRDEYGVKTSSLEIVDNELPVSGRTASVELPDDDNEIKKIILPPPRPKLPPPNFFKKVEKFPVPVPGDYPINITSPDQSHELSQPKVEINNNLLLDVPR